MAQTTLVSIIPYVISLVITASAGLIAWQQRSDHDARAFSTFALSQACVILASTGELVPLNVGNTLLWDNLELLFAASASVTLLIFITRLTGQQDAEKKNLTWGISALLLIVLVIVVLDSRSPILRKAVSVQSEITTVSLVYELTTLGLVLSLLNTALILTSLLMVMRHAMHAWGDYRKQALTVTAGIFFFLTGPFFNLALGYPLISWDIPPQVIGIGMIILAWGLIRYKLPGIIPIAQEILLENLRDPVVVLDAQDRVVYLNPSAHHFVSQDGADLAGKPAEEAFAPWGYLVKRFKNIEESIEEICIGEGIEARHYEVSITPLRGHNKRLAGRLLVVHDITDWVRAGQIQEKREEDLTALVQQRTAELIDMNRRLQDEVRERRRAEDSLRISDERYKLATIAGKVGIWEWIQEDDRIYAAPNLLALLGYPARKNPFTYHTWLALLHPEDRDRVIEKLSPYLYGETTDIELEFRLRHRERNYRTLRIRGKALMDASGKNRRILGTATDITQIKGLMTSLQHQDAILRSLNRSAELLITADNWQAVIDEVVRLLGEAMETGRVALFVREVDQEGTIRGSLVSVWTAAGIPDRRDDSQLQHIDVFKSGYSRLYQLWSSRQVYAGQVDELPEVEQGIMRLWGTSSFIHAPIHAHDELWGLLSVNAVGEARAWTAIEIDAVQMLANMLGNAVSRQIALEEMQLYAKRLQILREIDTAILAAESPEEIARSAVENIRRLITCQRASVLLFDQMNNQARILVSWSEKPSSLDSNTVFSLSDLRLATGDLLEGQRTLKPGKRQQQSLTQLQERVRSEGIQAYANLPLLIQGKIIGSLNIGRSDPKTFTVDEMEFAREVAVQLAIGLQQAGMRNQIQQYAEELEQRVAERTTELEAANQRLKSLSRIKDEFVANLSHELRTPISSLKLYHELLAMRPEKYDHYIGTLQRETNRLENLIEDLLMLSRLDQERVALNKETVDLNMMISDYIQDRTLLAQERGLGLRFSPQKGLPHVLGDSSLLGQTLGILLTNAINYTPEGGEIRVSTRTALRDGRQWVCLQVRDTGPGIEPDERRFIFTRFYRGKAGSESGTPGTGLGLAIAKAIIERHQGEIVCQESNNGGSGAVFTVWLPLANGNYRSPHEPHAEDASQPSAAGL